LPGLSVLLFAPACGKMNADDADDLFTAVTLVAVDVYDRCASGLEEAALNGSGEADGISVSLDTEALEIQYVVDGTASGGLGWEGTAEVDGVASFGDYTHDFDLDLDIVEVLVGAQAVELNGDLALVVGRTQDTTHKDYAYDISLNGEVTAKKGVKGTVDFDCDIHVSWSDTSQTYVYEVSGTVGAHDASAFTLAQLPDILEENR